MYWKKYSGGTHNFKSFITWNYFFFKTKIIAITRANSNEWLTGINNSIDSFVHC